ncbi:hypothetical protein XELAEV_18033326mg [Xenopus laevis]|uniref:Uncharacterized protein n=1 Tax=Xenopus laevis TaxID=8355 RepID=A0A974HEC0_XENLA|nr:hypothetical protein XELAEV_18033326mg [Xenopus laevis]
MSEQDKLSLEITEESGKEQTSTKTNQAEKDEKIQNQHNMRPKSGAKGKLVRSLAVCEEPSSNVFDDNFPENQEQQIH